RTSRHAPMPVGALFSAVARAMSDGSGRSAADVWCEEVAAWSAALPLAGDEIDVLSALGPTLGISHADDQVNHLRAAIRRLAEIQRRAEADREPRTRLWQYLGAGAGLVVAVLLA
ncbi:MAG TPA: stage III sporulation protein AB, partial [Limnochordia bacterium]